MAKNSMHKSFFFLNLDGKKIDFGGFWVAKRNQVGTKMESNIDFSENMENAFGARPLMPNWVQEVQVGSKHRLKIDQKRSSTWEGILASIFERFWWILGGKLGSKIEQKSIQKGIEKVMKKRRSPKWQKSRS